MGDNMFGPRIYDIGIVNKSMLKVLSCGDTAKKDFSLTRKGIEDTLCSFDYSGNNQKISSFVEHYKLPPMISSFYDFIFEQGEVPSQSQLSKKYLNTFFDKEPNNMFALKKEYRDSKRYSHTFNGIMLLPRVLRAYPSFLRDLHFYTICLESGVFSNQGYSLKQDFEKGLDLKLRYKTKEYYASLYIETARGNFFKDKKYLRHDYKGVPEIPLGVSLDDCAKFGRFLLYKDKHLERLINLIEKTI